MRDTSKRIGWIGLRSGALVALAGTGYIARNWLRYGRVDATLAPDSLLDRFMPEYEIRDQHETRVAAPAEVTFRAALAVNIRDSPVVRAIFRGRELLMRGERSKVPPVDAPLVEQVVALGWGVLAEDQDREIVLGAITKPWEPNPRFEPIPATEFAAFTQPTAVKIVWSLLVKHVAAGESIFRTETRVITTDAEARRRFRRYWAVVSPGIILIRREGLRLVKAAAEDAYQPNEPAPRRARNRSVARQPAR